jgi:hypothetical protein
MSLIEKLPLSESEMQVAACIDRGLERVGPNVRYLVYWHLQNIGHLKRKDIVSNPENFANALWGLYRESSAAVERAIVQEINATFGLSCQPTQLVAAIKSAREKCDRITLI